MAKVKVSAVRATAKKYATAQPPVPYVHGGESPTQQDCQGHVEICVRENGGAMSFMGSNDMLRNACDWVGTMAEAKAQGKLVPGAMIFQVNFSPKPEDYPKRYHDDGKGNAGHVGYYWGEDDMPLTHASSGAGRVEIGKLHSGWNMVGLAKAIDYSEVLGGNILPMPTPVPETPSYMQMGIVNTASGGLRLRETPGTDGKYILSIAQGTMIPLLAYQTVGGTIWAQTQVVNAKGAPFTGWVSMDFVLTAREEEPEEPVLSEYDRGYKDGYAAAMDELGVAG